MPEPTGAGVVWCQPLSYQGFVVLFLHTRVCISFRNTVHVLTVYKWESTVPVERLASLCCLEGWGHSFGLNGRSSGTSSLFRGSSVWCPWIVSQWQSEQLQTLCFAPYSYSLLALRSRPTYPRLICLSGLAMRMLDFACLHVGLFTCCKTF